MKSEDEVDTQRIAYSRTIVPSSMRSPYWKYFGFPSDNSNNILTRQKIVCTLCNTAIAYNKNTSNLRTHLMAKHSDLLHELQKQQTAAAVEGGTTRKRKHSNIMVDMPEVTLPTTQTRQKLESFVGYTSADDGSLIEVAVDEDDSVEDDHDNDDDMENHKHVQHDSDDNTIQLSAVLGYAEIVQNITTAGYSLMDVATPHTTTSASSFPTLPKSHNYTDLLVDMLVTDLLPLHTVSGHGFQQFYAQLVGNIENEQSSTLGETICERFATMQRKISAHVERQSHKSPYALSIEHYTNNDKFDIFNIYFNYYNNDCGELLSILYFSDIATLVKLTDILALFNLNYCAAVVTNITEINEELTDLTTRHEIPVINCLHTVLTRCLNQIFNTPAISTAFNEIHKLTEQAILQQDALLLTMPEIFSPCPWSKFNFLQFVMENLLLNDDMQHNDILNEMQQLVEYLSPLKITLDTIAEEPLPLCSLIRPLTVKLFEDHFTAFHNQSEYINLAKEIIENELPNSIIKNTFLNEATFFDARFQHDFIDRQQAGRIVIQQSICKRFKQLIDETNIKTSSCNKIEQESQAGSNRKSSLKSFFSRMDASAVSPCFTNNLVRKPPPQKRNIDLEFDKYKCEPTMDLEQCPIRWWQEYANKYKQLAKIADYFLCVPCCVNRLFRCDANERMLWLNKRFMLRQQNAAEKCLWYLHYNRACYDKIICGDVVCMQL